MSDTYINIKLNGAEMQALMRMAEEGCRPMHEQLRYLLHREARALGLLPTPKEDRPIAQAATQA